MSTVTDGALWFGSLSLKLQGLLPDSESLEEAETDAFWCFFQFLGCNSYSKHIIATKQHKCILSCDLVCEDSDFMCKKFYHGEA